MKKQIAFSDFLLKFQAPVIARVPDDGCCGASFYCLFFVLFSPSVPEQLFYFIVTTRCKQHICQQTNMETRDKVFSTILELWHSFILGWFTYNQQVLQMEQPLKNYSHSFSNWEIKASSDFPKFTLYLKYIKEGLIRKQNIQMHNFSSKYKEIASLQNKN